MAATDRLLGASGREDAGVFMYLFPRSETVTWMGRILRPTMGPATTINFQPTAVNETVVSGDFALNSAEVANVTYALRDGGFNLVKPHTHEVFTEANLVHVHFWGHGDPLRVTAGLRAAVDQHLVRSVR